MKKNWMFATALILLPLTVTVSLAAEAKSPKRTASSKKSKKGPKKISISFEGQKAKGRGPASVEISESAAPILEKESHLAIQTHQGSCIENQDSSGWHLPVDESAYSCTLSGRNKASDPSRGLGFFVNKKNFKIFSMTEGEVIGVVGELMGCKVIVKPARCPAGHSSKECNITYTIPNISKNAQNECVIPGIKMGTQLKACQKIAEVAPSKSFNLVRIETNSKAPLQEVIASYKKSSKERKQCSRDKALLASTLY